MKLSRCTRNILLAIAALAPTTLPSLAPGQAVLTKLGDFDGDTGQYPATAMVFGPDGNLYGTTQSGGSTTVNPPSQGCIYTLSPAGGNLSRFASFYDARGLAPQAPLILGSDGNFYSTTYGGSVPGPNNTTSSYYGSIIQVKLDGTVTSLYQFTYDSSNQDFPNGGGPIGPLVEINPGIFLGSASYGGGGSNGTSAVGTVFEFNANTGAFGTLYTFHGYGSPTPGVDSGYRPEARIVSGGNGFFYSTTISGGPSLLGNIFQTGAAAGEASSIYDFGATNDDGGQPSGGLTLGPDLELYGTTVLGGTADHGVYYRISSQAGYELLGSFNGAGNGQQPYGEPVLASDGNLYGTTTAGGSSGLGTIYQLTTAGVLTTVYTFPVGNGSGVLGYNPRGTLVQGPDGRLYGTTVDGGTSGLGTVFALSLNPVITSASSASLDQGQAFSFPVTATNTPTSFAATALPPGLSIDPTTGLISGAPTQAGVYPVALSATNAMGTGTLTLTLTVTASVPTVTLVATTPTVTEGSGQIGEFTLGLSAAQTSDVFVNLIIKGTAINGTDYTLLKTTAKIKAGKTSKAIKIVPQGDLGGAAKKTVKVGLAPGNGYTVGTAGKVKVTILADPQ